MPSKVVVFVVVSLLAVALIFSSASQVLAKPRQAGPVTCRFGGPGKVMCCQDRPSTTYASEMVTWCTICDNTSPPSNCSDRYCVSGCAFARLTGNITGTLLPPTNALPPPGNNTGPTIKVPPGMLNGLPNVTSALPPGNNTGTVIKVPPGEFKPIGNLTNALPGQNNTGTSHPPPPPPTLLAKQPSGHDHHKGSNPGTSTSGGNSTGH